MANYKSPCKGCLHLHSRSLGLCDAVIRQVGTIALTPHNIPTHTFTSSNGIITTSGTYPYDYTGTFNYQGGKQYYSYEQEVHCPCNFYVPSDNLEFMEWKYDNTIH